MLKAYRYQLEPNKSQRYALARTLDVCRELYNDCLYQRKLQQIRRYEQSKCIMRERPLQKVEADRGAACAVQGLHSAAAALGKVTGAGSVSGEGTKELQDGTQKSGRAADSGWLT